jgi:hypothetical protein
MEITQDKRLMRLLGRLQKVEYHLLSEDDQDKCDALEQSLHSLIDSQAEPPQKFLDYAKCSLKNWKAWPIKKRSKCHGHRIS